MKKVNTAHLTRVPVDARFPEFSVGTSVALIAKPEKLVGRISRVMTDDWMVLIGIDMESGGPERLALAEFLVPYVVAQ
jgi:hypothetical protein